MDGHILEHGIYSHLAWSSLVALLLGIMFQPLASIFNVILTPLIMLVIYFSVMTVDYSSILDELRSWWHCQIYLAVMVLLVLPGLAYYVLCFAATKLYFIHESFAVGTLLVHSVAAASSAPGLVFAMGGKLERAAVCLMITSLLMIVTQPFVLHYVGHLHIVLHFSEMVYALSTIMLPPIVLGVLTKSFAPRAVDVVLPHMKFFIVLLCMMILLGCTKGIDKIFLEHFIDFVLPAVCVCILVGVVFALWGWFFAFDSNVQSRLTTSLLFAYPNAGLMVAIVPKWFPGHIELIAYVVINAVVIGMSPAVVKLIFSRVMRKYT